MTEPIDVRRFRQEHNLTQAQLAELVGVKPHTVRDWERRKLTDDGVRRLRALDGETPPPSESSGAAEPEPADRPPGEPSAEAATVKSAAEAPLPVLSLERRVALLYEWLASGMTWLNPGSPEAQRSAAIVKRHSQMAARAWIQWGAESPRVQKFLETLTGPGAAGQVVAVHALIVAEIWSVYQAAPANVVPPAAEGAANVVTEPPAAEAA